MQTHRSKRRDIAQRILTYVIMTASVFVAVGVCLFLILGYSVDEKTGKAEQGGLIQYRTFPDNARVTLDGRQLNASTPTKTNSSAGEHAVSMKLDKYRDWNKKFTLDKAELLWLNALLVPKSISTTEAVAFDAVASMSSSPNKKWIAVIENANEPVLKIIDIRDEKKPKSMTITIPSEVAKAKADTDRFEISEWDFGSKFLLVKQTSGQTTEWLRIDTTDEKKSSNITQRFGLELSQVHFSGNSGNVFYALAEGGSLRKLNLSEETISSPVAEDVREFKLYKNDHIVYVAQNSEKQKVGIYKEGVKKPTIVKEFKKLEPVHAAIADYYADMYLVIGDGENAEIYKNPLQEKLLQKFGTFSLDQGINWVYFSNNGQFIVAQNGIHLSSYNLERKESHTYAIPGATNYTSSKHLKWLDDFHLWSDTGGVLTLFEFDGSNSEAIGDVTPGHEVTLSANGKRLFSVGANTVTNKPMIQSSVMVLE